jgi:hypothetical protein
MQGDPISLVDRTIDRLDHALRTAGFDGLAPATEATFLDELEKEIAPYSLPQDLRRFWERIEPSGLRVRGYSLPEPCGPRGALDTYRLNRDPAFLPFYGPPLLLPIARISGDQWSVELVSAWGTGGTLFSHDGETMRIEYPSFTDLIDVYAELIEEDRFVRWDNGYGSVSREDEQERRQARLTASVAHPQYGETREFGGDPAGWPAHWLESAGIAGDSSDSSPESPSR